MPIEKGEEWGRPGSLASDAPSANSDAELARHLRDGANQVRPTGGDLARTLGVSEASLRRDAAMLLPVDALDVTLDGEAHRCIAHVVIGSARRPQVIAANAAFLGPWNVAPRAHPGDGKVDVVSFELGAVDWLKARRRLPTGTHVPHPDIKVRAVRSWSREFDRPITVQLDGVGGFRARHVEVHVAPDAIVVGV
jgi:hypothetical protein